MTADAQAEIDELFPPKVGQLPLIPPPSRVTVACLACQLPASFVVGAPHICGLCAEDVARTRDHLDGLRLSALRRRDAATATWASARDGADPAVRAAVHRAVVALEVRALAQIGGPPADLARAYLRWRADMATAEATVARVARALEAMERM